jgi:hypothetical protein
MGACASAPAADGSSGGGSGRGRPPSRSASSRAASAAAAAAAAAAHGGAAAESEEEHPDFGMSEVWDVIKLLGTGETGRVKPLTGGLSFGRRTLRGPHRSFVCQSAALECPALPGRRWF